jgi:hypothetical protein
VTPGVAIPTDLTSLGLDELRVLWRQVFGREAPVSAGRVFLTGNLAYQRECRLHGGLSPGIVRQLHAIAIDEQKHRPGRRGSIRPGTKFVRVWQEQPHEVTVTAEFTYLYRDKVYTSLSAIARHITGTSWNGHAFFGLRKHDPHAS